MLKMEVNMNKNEVRILRRKDKTFLAWQLVRIRIQKQRDRGRYTEEYASELLKINDWIYEDRLFRAIQGKICLCCDSETHLCRCN